MENLNAQQKQYKFTNFAKFQSEVSNPHDTNSYAPLEML